MKKIYPDTFTFNNWKDWAEALLATLRVPSEVTPVQLPLYSVSALPNAAQAGMLIFVVDEVGGAVPAYSDGSTWRRVTDGVGVS